MASTTAAGLVVGQVESHSLVHLRVAGTEQTLCGRATGPHWPSSNFRTTGCLTCHAGALAHGHHHALDTDGSWLDLEQLLDEGSDGMTA